MPRHDERNDHAEAFQRVLANAVRLANEPCACEKCEESRAVIRAVRDYYYALDMREHGTLARIKAFETIERVLGMQWVPGQEKEAREKAGDGRV